MNNGREDLPDERLRTVDAGSHPVPTLPFDVAAEVGVRLARQWQLLVGPTGPEADDLVWADLVQFVLRHARDCSDDRGPHCDSAL